MEPSDADIETKAPQMRDRAWRRGQRQRCCHNRSHYFTALWRWVPEDLQNISSEERKTIIGRMARTPKSCSCYGCGGARKSEGPTWQEKVSERTLKEERKRVNWKD